MKSNSDSNSFPLHYNRSSTAWLLAHRFSDNENDSWMLVHIRQYSPLVDTRGAIGAVLRNVAAPAFNAATIFSANGNTRDSTNVGQLCVFVVTIFTNVTRHVEKTDEKEWFFRNCAALRFGKRKHRITKRVDRFRHRHSRDCFVVSSIYLVQGTYKLRISTMASWRRKLTVIKNRIASERDRCWRETLVTSKPRGERVRPTSWETSDSTSR